MEKAADLIVRLNEIATALARHPNVAIVGSNQLSQDAWRAFAVERYISAMIFEPLLGTALTTATAAKDEKLVNALTDNLHDELGMDAEGKVTIALSHAAWRRDFYDALEIDDAMLSGALATPAVTAYMQGIRSVIATNDYLVMAGALLALELCLPVEFLAMQQGRNAVFANVFLDQATDDDAKKAWRARARLYLDDHITHDAKAHYPNLLAALQPHVDNAADMERILAGITATEKAKLAFYDNLSLR